MAQHCFGGLQPVVCHSALKRRCTLQSLLTALCLLLQLSLPFGVSLKSQQAIQASARGFVIHTINIIGAIGGLRVAGLRFRGLVNYSLLTEPFCSTSNLLRSTACLGLPRKAKWGWFLVRRKSLMRTPRALPTKAKWGRFLVRRKSLMTTPRALPLHCVRAYKQTRVPRM